MSGIDLLQNAAIMALALISIFSQPKPPTRPPTKRK